MPLGRFEHQIGSSHKAEAASAKINAITEVAMAKMHTRRSELGTTIQAKRHELAKANEELDTVTELGAKIEKDLRAAKSGASAAGDMSAMHELRAEAMVDEQEAPFAPTALPNGSKPESFMILTRTFFHIQRHHQQPHHLAMPLLRFQLRFLTESCGPFIQYT